MALRSCSAYSKKGDRRQAAGAVLGSQKGVPRIDCRGERSTAIIAAVKALRLASLVLAMAFVGQNVAGALLPRAFCNGLTIPWKGATALPFAGRPSNGD